MKLLGFEETKKLLGRYKIPLVRSKLVNTKKEAKEAAQKFGYPVVLKISSPEVLHRTEKGLVRVGIGRERDLEKAFDEISRACKRIKIEGILIQKTAKGIEIACGMKRDVSFGPVLMFGLGGVFIEVLKDVSFAITPLTRKEAIGMIKGIKGYKILKGYRGKTPVIFSELTKLLTQLSKLSIKHPEIKEIDFNPVFVNKKKVQVADFKFLV
ncbi:acetate--CoA ligase family protein [bacterium]|nr:acetate--CoA ligase family protein [bacterium]